MATDPGDLVLDPTCGSGTTATVAEQWGRRWITIDTSRVALALARTRLMSARYPYYLLADSPEGRRKEQEVSGASAAARRDAGRHPPGLRLRARAARHPEVDRQQRRDRRDLRALAGRARALRATLNERWDAVIASRRRATQEPALAWVARSARDDAFGRLADPARGRLPDWPDAARAAHAKWWEGRIARQREIDASIAKAADVELLYDRPYEDKARVRVAGPFTVESLSPHRVVPADAAALFDEVDELLDDAPRAKGAPRRPTSPR